MRGELTVIAFVHFVVGHGDMENFSSFESVQAMLLLWSYEGRPWFPCACSNWITFCWWTFLLLLGIGRVYILLVHFITREMTSQFDFVCCYVLSNHNILDNNTFFITRENSFFGVISSFLSFLLLLGQGEHTQIRQPKANNLEIKNLRWWHAMEIGECSLPLPWILILWLNM